MNFVAIDVETANSKRAICQIGIAKFVNGVLAEEWVSLINPEVEFDARCINIHGICENDVFGKPKFNEVYDKLNYFMEGSVCIAHSGNGFDQDAIERAFYKYSLQSFNTKWIDSCNVARIVWPQHSNHKLNTLCEKIGFQLKHHDALEDAKACGHVLLAAIKESNLDFDTLIEMPYQFSTQKKYSKNKKISLKGNLEGSLYSEVVLFTGELSISGMSKVEASKLVAIYGADVVTSISKKVTLLIAGKQEPRTLKGKPNSTSYLTAEKYITEGHKIRILNETEFFELIDNSSYE